MSDRKRGDRQMYADVGIAGRKTGIQVADNGRRDELGMEAMDSFFSPSRSIARKSQTMTESSMDVDRSRGWETKRPSAVSARFRSPIKTHLNSPALRASASGKERDSRKLSLTPNAKPPSVHASKSPRNAVEKSPHSVQSSGSMGVIARRLDFSGLLPGNDDEQSDDEAVVAEQETDLEVIHSPSPAPPKKKRGLMQRPAVQAAMSAVRDENYSPTARKDFLLSSSPSSAEALESAEQLHSSSRSPTPSPPPKTKRSGRKPKGFDATAASKELSPNIQSKHTTSLNKLQPKSLQHPGRPRADAAAKENESVSQKTARKRARTESESMDPDGIRRSGRTRIKPLEYWRNERIVYQLGNRRKSGPALPEIREVIRLDPEEQPKRRIRHSAQPASIRRLKRKRQTSEMEESERDSEFDELPVVEAKTMSYEEVGQEDEQIIAIAGSSIETKPVASGNFSFSGIFKDGDFAATGILELKPGQIKPPKPTRHNSMIFYVIDGMIEASVHRTTFRLRRGGHFFAPRGNTYEIANVGKRLARLLYLQATDTAYNELLAENDEE